MDTREILHRMQYSLFCQSYTGYWKVLSQEDQMTCIVKANENDFQQRLIQHFVPTLLDFRKAQNIVWRENSS